MTEIKIGFFKENDLVLIFQHNMIMNFICNSQIFKIDNLGSTSGLDFQNCKNCTFGGFFFPSFLDKSPILIRFQIL